MSNEKNIITDSYGNKIAYSIESFDDTDFNFKPYTKGLYISADTVGIEASTPEYENLLKNAKEYLKNKNIDFSHLPTGLQTQSILKAYIDSVVQENISQKVKEGNASIVEQAYDLAITTAPSVKNGQIMGGLLTFSEAQLKGEEGFDKSIEVLKERLTEEFKLEGENMEHKDLYNKFITNDMKSEEGSLPKNLKAEFQSRRFDDAMSKKIKENTNNTRKNNNSHGYINTDSARETR